MNCLQHFVVISLVFELKPKLSQVIILMKHSGQFSEPIRTGYRNDSRVPFSGKHATGVKWGKIATSAKLIGSRQQYVGSEWLEHFIRNFKPIAKARKNRYKEDDSAMLSFRTQLKNRLSIVN